MATKAKAIVPAERLAGSILVIRGHRVMLDADLAGLYGVETKVLLQAVRRNAERFPDDFMFELESEEWEALRSQIVTSKSGRGGRRYAPFVFTEQGVAMLSTVLHSPRAIAVNIEIMRAFVRLREVLAANKDLAKQFAALEARIDKRLADQDEVIVEILQAIRKLMEAPSSPQPESRPRRKIGFV